MPTELGHAAFAVMEQARVSSAYTQRYKVLYDYVWLSAERRL